MGKTPKAENEKAILSSDELMLRLADLPDGVVSSRKFCEVTEIDPYVLRKIQAEQEKEGVDTMAAYGIGRGNGANSRGRIFVRRFRERANEILDLIKNSNVTLGNHKRAKKGQTLSDLIAEGGSYRLTSLDKVKDCYFQSRDLRSEFNRRIKEESAEALRKDMGIWRDGSMYVFDPATFKQFQAKSLAL